MVPPSDYLATILAAGNITSKSQIPAAGILVQRPYHPGCRNAIHDENNIGCIHLFQFQLGLCSVNCEMEPFMQSNCRNWSLCGNKKNQLCIVTVAMCYAEISICGLGLGLSLGLEDLALALWFWPRPHSFGLSLCLGLDVLASFNITGKQ